MSHSVFYQELVDYFKKYPDKSTIVDKMIKYCQDETPENVYKLKKQMEIHFVSDVQCRSLTEILGRTSVNSGCDLREILFDIHGKIIDNGQELLTLFEEKKLQPVWHIMTDIDDTLYPHKGIAGKDESWAQKKAYPGIKVFYDSFYDVLPKLCRYSTVLSATPGAIKVLRINSPTLTNIIGEFGFIQGMDRKRDVLSSYIKGKAFQTFGKVKFSRFMQYAQIFPEYKFLFIGDNGQGDVGAGEQMLAEMPDRCTVFIHDVYSGKYETEKIGTNDGMYYFKNYFDLAKLFQDMKIFSGEKVNLIRTSVVDETKHSTKFKSFYKSAYQEAGSARTRKSHRTRKSRRHSRH
jgi:hypothetical protein